MCSEKWNRHTRRAFTLVEIMVVIVIVGLLAGLLTIHVRAYLDSAKQNIARKEIATVMDALETFYATHGRYPTTEEGINVLTAPTEKLPEKLLSRKPVDPWSNAYQYACEGPSGPYTVVCLGADGREGGEGINADISSKELRE